MTITITGRVTIDGRPSFTYTREPNITGSVPIDRVPALLTILSRRGQA